jgi:hypothetical protein
MNEKRTEQPHRHQPCGCSGSHNPVCRGDSLKALKEKLHAPYVNIDRYAAALKITVDQAERFLGVACRQHNLDAVEAGIEGVGENPIFIARPGLIGFEVSLYSLLPKEQWRHER